MNLLINLLLDLLINYRTLRRRRSSRCCAAARTELQQLWCSSVAANLLINLPHLEAEAEFAPLLRSSANRAATALLQLCCSSVAGGGGGVRAAAQQDHRLSASSAGTNLSYY